MDSLGRHRGATDGRSPLRSSKADTEPRLSLGEGTLPPGLRGSTLRWRPTRSPARAALVQPHRAPSLPTMSSFPPLRTSSHIALWWALYDGSYSATLSRMNAAAPILIGYDGSDTARRAVQEAAELFTAPPSVGGYGVGTRVLPTRSARCQRTPRAWGPHRLILWPRRRSTTRLRLTPIASQRRGLRWRSPSDFRPRRSQWPMRASWRTRLSEVARKQVCCRRRWLQGAERAPGKAGGQYLERSCEARLVPGPSGSRTIGPASARRRVSRRLSASKSFLLPRGSQDSRHVSPVAVDPYRVYLRPIAGETRDVGPLFVSCRHPLLIFADHFVPSPSGPDSGPTTPTTGGKIVWLLSYKHPGSKGVA